MSKKQNSVRAFTIRVVFAVPSNTGTSSVDLNCESHEEAQALLDQIEQALIDGTPIKLRHGTFHQTVMSPKSVLYAQMELKKLRDYN